jgi:hypothetical protein
MAEAISLSSFMDYVFTWVFLALAFVVVPLTYFAFCVWMVFQRVSWLCYPAYFVLFGTVGGWCLAIGMSPSGLAASCMIFLLTLAPLSCLISSVVLQLRGGRTRIEKVAMISGYVYPVLLVDFCLVGQIYSELFSHKP